MKKKSPSVLSKLQFSSVPQPQLSSATDDWSLHMTLAGQRSVHISKAVPAEVHMPLRTLHPINEEEKKHGEMTEQEKKIPFPNFSLATSSHVTIPSSKGMAQSS